MELLGDDVLQLGWDRAMPGVSSGSVSASSTHASRKPARAGSSSYDVPNLDRVSGNAQEFAKGGIHRSWGSSSALLAHDVILAFVEMVGAAFAALGCSRAASWRDHVASLAGLDARLGPAVSNSKQKATEHRMSQTTLIIILSISGNLGALVTLRQVRFIFWRAFKERFQRFRRGGEGGLESCDEVSDEDYDEDYARAQLQAKEERRRQRAIAGAAAAGTASPARLPGAKTRPPPWAAGSAGPQHVAQKAAPEPEGSSEEWTDIAEGAPDEAAEQAEAQPPPGPAMPPEPSRPQDLAAQHRTSAASSSRTLAKAQPTSNASLRPHSADVAAGRRRGDPTLDAARDGQRHSSDSGGSSGGSSGVAGGSSGIGASGTGGSAAELGSGVHADHSSNDEPLHTSGSSGPPGEVARGALSPQAASAEGRIADAAGPPVPPTEEDSF
eukprot:SRR837773.7637.p1 GENE.SRR837773.7637~~SRR837773.7637.p1  ORF type:complete len:441 (-),score=13.69 SRR837773.7637:25-1347(-)